jgi:hypothetical protein
MGRRLRLISALVGATGVGLLSATSAGAATNLGETFDPPDSCAPDTTYLLTKSPGNTYTVPFGGVITSWSFQAGSVPPVSVRLKVGRVVSGTDLSDVETDLSIIGQSATETVPANTLKSYTTRVAVQQGDFLGIYLGGEGDELVQCADDSDLDFRDHYNNSEVFAGATAPFTLEGGAQFDVAAVLEPDADHDGFGDETQDQCATNAGTQGSCPPVTPAKKKKCKKHKKKHRSAESAKKKCKKKKR